MLKSAGKETGPHMSFRETQYVMVNRRIYQNKLKNMVMIKSVNFFYMTPFVMNKLSYFIAIQALISSNSNLILIRTVDI